VKTKDDVWGARRGAAAGGLFRLRAAVVLLLCLAHGVAAGARQAGGGAGAATNAAELTATREGRLRVFDETWALVRERYYDPRLRGLDWAALGAKERAAAGAAGGGADLYAALRRLLAHLRDPHTRVFAPGEGADWRVRSYVSVGVEVREAGGETVVSGVERGSAAWRAGVRAGDVLASVDGVPSTTLLARRAAERPAANASTARLLAAARLFDGPRDTPASLVFRRGARARSVVLRREPRLRAPEFSSRALGGGVGLVRFNIFTPEVAARFARALGGELKGARALVIDLRDNGGGEAEAMTDVASALLPAGTRLGAFTGRRGEVWLDPRTRSALLSSADALPRFAGRVVVLTGARTASAAEVLAAALREAGRAVVVGEPTCGCVLGIRRRHTLPDGGTLDISETDYRTAGGARLEGAGVSPDHAVAPTREDLREGRDPALARAVEILRRGD
jgi:carboxyl-terminal processing protease